MVSFSFELALVAGTTLADEKGKTRRYTVYPACRVNNKG